MQKWALMGFYTLGGPEFRRSVGRVGLGRSTGITREPGPGCAGDSPGPVYRLSGMVLGPSTLRACLHAWFPCSGCPLFSLHPGASRCRSYLRVPVFLVSYCAWSMTLDLLRVTLCSVVHRQTTVKCLGSSFRGISPFLGASYANGFETLAMHLGSEGSRGAAASEASGPPAPACLGPLRIVTNAFAFSRCFRRSEHVSGWVKRSREKA